MRVLQSIDERKTWSEVFFAICFDLPATFISRSFSFLLCVFVCQRKSMQPPPKTTQIMTDPIIRLMILIGAILGIIALTLTIVGTATYSWYYTQDTNGATVFYNLFTFCTGNILNSTSNCYDMPRHTFLGLKTQEAAGLLSVGICFLGAAVLVTVAMNFIQLPGTLALLSPTLFFFAALFIMAGLAQGSRGTLYNSYSAYLVETGQLLTILTMGIIGFAGGRSHFRYVESV